LMSLNQSDRLRPLQGEKNVSFLDRIALAISTWFGIGLLPGIPGTLGTAGAVPLYVLIDSLGGRYRALFVLIAVAGAIWSSHRAQRILRKADSREIVVDEVAGFLLTTVLLPFTWLTLIAGFLLFRFFDILKPPPIRKIEQEVRGGLGIVLDDLVAGAYAHLCLRLLLYLFT
jgi:phosphatidylglycerophosphatase A